MKSLKLYFLLGVFISTVGCQNTPCRELEKQKNEGKVSAAAAAATEVDSPAKRLGASQLKVRVYKPDGSLQCGMGKKISLEAMEKELKGIQVISRSNRNDGLMRIQVCGAPTGNANVYEINREDLDKALKQGFKEWTFD